MAQPDNPRSQISPESFLGDEKFRNELKRRATAPLSPSKTKKMRFLPPPKASEKTVDDYHQYLQSDAHDNPNLTIKVPLAIVNEDLYVSIALLKKGQNDIAHVVAKLVEDARKLEKNSR